MDSTNCPLFSSLINQPLDYRERDVPLGTGSLILTPPTQRVIMLFKSLKLHYSFIIYDLKVPHKQLKSTKLSVTIIHDSTRGE